MANLSDLLAQPLADASAPGWIEQMDRPAGFIEGPVWSLSAGVPQTPAPNAGPSAVEEAYAAGEAAGREAAEQIIAQERAVLSQLKTNVIALDESAREALTDQLRQTVLSLCDGLLETVAIDPDALEKRCRKAAERLGSLNEALHLQIHPLDLEILGAAAIPSWKVETDETLPRGTIRVSDRDGAVEDGPDQWRAAIARAIGA